MKAFSKLLGMFQIHSKACALLLLHPISSVHPLYLQTPVGPTASTGVLPLLLKREPALSTELLSPVVKLSRCHSDTFKPPYSGARLFRCREGENDLSSGTSWPLGRPRWPGVIYLFHLVALVPGPKHKKGLLCSPLNHVVNWYMHSRLGSTRYPATETFSCSFKKYLQNTYYMQGAVLGTVVDTRRN